MFDSNLKLNFHIINVFGKLRFITCKLVKIKNIIPIHTIIVVNFFTSSISFLIWSNGVVT